MTPNQHKARQKKLKNAVEKGKLSYEYKTPG